MVKKHKGITPGRNDVYEALRKEGNSKEKSARIANEGKTAAGRKAMAKKAAATRKAKGR